MQQSANKVKKSSVFNIVSQRLISLWLRYLILDIRYSPRKRAGFTLIETIIYMGILTILIAALMALFTAILDVQLESKAVASVDQDGRYILARLAHDMQDATSIASPSAGLTDDSLKITVNSIDYIYELNSDGNVQITNNNGTDVLNSFNTGITGLTFQRIGDSGNDDTIQVIFTITSKIRKTSGTQYETRTFKTTLGRHTI